MKTIYEVRVSLTKTGVKKFVCWANYNEAQPHYEKFVFAADNRTRFPVQMALSVNNRQSDPLTDLHGFRLLRIAGKEMFNPTSSISQFIFSG